MKRVLSYLTEKRRMKIVPAKDMIGKDSSSHIALFILHGEIGEEDTLKKQNLHPLLFVCFCREQKNYLKSVGKRCLASFLVFLTFENGFDAKNHKNLPPYLLHFFIAPLSNKIRPKNF